MKLLPEILESAEVIQAIRRDIHAHPELCFEEKRTSDVVAQQLESWGIKIHRGLGKTGVVGIIEGSLGKGRSIGLRADMDALPLQEHNHFEHASQHPGKMHACGHDGHVTIMATSVHLSRVLGSVFKMIVFLKWQGIHVCPQANAATFTQRTFNDAYNTSFT